MTDRLSIYNNALIACGEEKLADLTENRPARHYLDAVWNSGFVRRCLESGDWNHAIRSVRMDADPDVDTEFGFPNIFDKPDDWCRTVAVCSDEFFRVPLLDYSDKAGAWSASLETIFVEYVSDDADYGGDFSKWPECFTEWVEVKLATRVYKRLANASTDLDKLKRDEKRLLLEAKSKDARGQPTTFPPSGRWSRARGGTSARLSDRREGR